MNHCCMLVLQGHCPLVSSWITLCGAIRFGTCLHGYGEEVSEPELALVGGQLALGHLVADAIVL